MPVEHDMNALSLIGRLAEELTRLKNRKRTTDQHLADAQKDADTLNSLIADTEARMAATLDAVEAKVRADIAAETL